MKCIKCGKNDISISYHNDQHVCLFNSLSTKVGEHLNHACRCCGYDWCEEIKDKKK